MFDSGNRTRRRHANRATEIQLFEENAISLANLIQLQNEDHVLDNVVNASDVDSASRSEGYGDVFPEDNQCDDNDFQNKIHYSSHHPNINENNESKVREDDSSVESNDLHPEDDSVKDSEIVGNSLSRNEPNSDNSGNEFNNDSNDSEQCLEEYQKPNKLANFALRVSDFSPEVWKIIKGEEEEKTPEDILKTELASWASKFKLKRNAVDELLHTLRNHGHHKLPACAKTLMRTPRNTQGMVKSLAGGQFWYRGIQTALLKFLTAAYVESLEDGTVVIDIFIDGLCPHKSVTRSIWPIAGCLKGQKQPFVIALWCGCLKEPSSVHEFFEEFVRESSDLMENGLVCHGMDLKFSIRRYIADAPARAFMRQVKGHNSYNSCERCTEPGEWKFRRITYDPNHVNSLRSDETFQNQSHAEHHTGVSPLLTLGTKMISQCPLDIMHMAYLGVSRRLFVLLLERKAGRFKLSDANVSKLDRLCLFLRVYCPSDFARRPRELSKYKLFKATEWRRLLLYDGFILLKNQMHKEVYECYLLFACGMRILLDSDLRSEFSSDAHDLLMNFVKRCYKKLGASFVVYNVHHLQHLVADCIIHGDPEGFGCFKYENYLGVLKSLLLAAGRDLQQLICRLIEQSLLPIPPSVNPSNERFYMPYANRPTLDCKGKQLEAIECVGSVIRVLGDKPRDSFIETSSQQVIVIENIVDCGSSTYIIGRKFLKKCDYFKFPFPSSSLNIYRVSQLGPLEKWKIQEIKHKVVYYPINVQETEYDVHDWRGGEGLSLPLLHSEV